MKIIHLNVGPLQTNCYIAWAPGSTGCAIIDPGEEAARILTTVQENGLTVEAVFLTHGHFDHISGAKALHEKTGCKVYINPKEQALPDRLTNGKFFCTDPYAQGDTVTAGGLTFSVMETPGHSVGCVCLICGDVIFSGDTLFAGTCGRTDLPTSSWNAITESLKRLSQLPGDYTVYPGHGRSTTMNEERADNPYMQ